MSTINRWVTRGCQRNGWSTHIYENHKYPLEARIDNDNDKKTLRSKIQIYRAYYILLCLQNEELQSKEARIFDVIYNEIKNEQVSHRWIE